MIPDTSSCFEEKSASKTKFGVLFASGARIDVWCEVKCYREHFISLHFLAVPVATLRRLRVPQRASL